MIKKNFFIIIIIISSLTKLLYKLKLFLILLSSIIKLSLILLIKGNILNIYIVVIQSYAHELSLFENHNLFLLLYIFPLYL